MPSNFIAQSYDRLSEWLASRVPSLSTHPCQLEYVLIYLQNVAITVPRNNSSTRDFSLEIFNGFQLSGIAWTCEQYPELYPSYLDLIDRLWVNNGKMHLEALAGSVLGCGIPDCSQRLQNRIVTRQLRFSKAVLTHVNQDSPARAIALDFTTNCAQLFTTSGSPYPYSKQISSQLCETLLKVLCIAEDC